MRLTVSSPTLLMWLAKQITTEAGAFTNMKTNSTYMAINFMDNPNLFLLVFLLVLKFALDTHMQRNAVGLSKGWCLMFALSRTVPQALVSSSCWPQDSWAPRLVVPPWWLALRPCILLSIHSDLEFTRAHPHRLRRESAPMQKIVRKGDLVGIQERLQWWCTRLS